MQAGHIPSLNNSVLLAVSGDSHTLFLLESIRNDLNLTSEPLGAMNTNLHPWSLTVEGSLYDDFFLHLDQDIGLRTLGVHTYQLEETSNNATNPTLTSPALVEGTPSQLSPSHGTSHTSQTNPIVSSGHQSYQCSWHLYDPGAQCNYVVSNRQEFLQHLAETHRVSGESNEIIICQLLDLKTSSACTKPIKRGNFPRHADTHYPLRYYCQHCPLGTSFSRQDSWRKHVKDKHPEGFSAS